MKTHNPENKRFKREYFTFLKEAGRYSEASLDGVTKALHRFKLTRGSKTSNASTYNRLSGSSGT